jgi:hypothetical protein
MGKISVPVRIFKSVIRDFAEGDKERLMRKWERREIAKIEDKKEME